MCKNLSTGKYHLAGGETLVAYERCMMKYEFDL